ncbi:MAG: F0F1 ATP synthase subunit delta [Planctomycetes bacterium]|nr:F0F1 ATP synthase subunit delta [Planctomycetota bacterium]
MIERTLAKRYAAALLRITDAEGTTEETESMLLALKGAYERDKAFRAVLGQPQIPRAFKKRVLRRAFETTARRSFLEFLELLVDKNRAEILPEIAEMFDRLADVSKGVVRVQVRSWRPLGDAQRSGLQTRLERLTGKKIEIEAQADPALKGGMLVRIGDTVIDGSVAHRLKVLGERLKELEKR